MKKEEYLERLGKKIEELRIEKGISQTDFAKLIGISRMQLYRFEKGQREIGVHGIGLIATALNVKASELINC